MDTWGSDLTSQFNAIDILTHETIDPYHNYPAMRWTATSTGSSASGVKYDGDFMVNNTSMTIQILDPTKYFAGFMIQFHVKDYSSEPKLITLTTGGVACDSGLSPHNSTSDADLALYGDCSGKPQEFTFSLAHISSVGVRLRYVYAIFGTYSAEETGFFGGEVYYLSENEVTFGSAAHARLYLWDEDGTTTKLSESYTNSMIIGGVTTYEIVIPEYTGTNAKGWTSFIVLRYNPEYDSDTTLVNEHIYNQTGDLAASYWKEYNRWWAQYYGEGNTFSLEGNKVSDLYGFYSGNTYYMEITESGWNVSRNKAVYFYNAIGAAAEDTYVGWALCKLVKGHLNGEYTHGLYEFVAPQAAGGIKVNWSKYIVVELKSGTTLDWDNKYKQSPTSGGYTINSFNNVIKSNGQDMYSITDESRLTFFDNYFMNTIGGACDYNGGTDIDGLKAAWADVAEQLPTKAKIAKVFKAETANESGTLNERAAAKYDYVYHKYNSSYPTDINDFAGRTEVGGGYSYSGIATNNPLINMGMDSNTMIICVIFVVASISGVAAYFYISKRRRVTK